MAYQIDSLALARGSLGSLQLIDSVVGLADPELPIHQKQQQSLGPFRDQDNLPLPTIRAFSASSFIFIIAF